MTSRTARQILLDRRREVEAVVQTAEPFSPDHRVYPQGWSWAMIERETARRFQFAHEQERAQDWRWAVEELRERDRISPHGLEAARRLIDIQERAADGWKDDAKGGDRPDPHARHWDREVCKVIAASAWGWAMRSPCVTPAREAVFWFLFNPRQPSLPMVRVHGRPGGARYNARGTPIRMNERETIERVCWAVETVIEFFADRDRGFGCAA